MRHAHEICFLPPLLAADPRQQGHTASDGRGFKELAALGCALMT